VGSDEDYFARFEAVREAYFPASGMWVGEYPFLDRRAMVGRCRLTLSNPR